jgi:hypothetical protein
MIMLEHETEAGPRHAVDFFTPLRPNGRSGQAFAHLRQTIGSRASGVHQQHSGLPLRQEIRQAWHRRKAPVPSAREPHNPAASSLTIPLQAQMLLVSVSCCSRAASAGTRRTCRPSEAIKDLQQDRISAVKRADMPTGAHA